MERIETDILIIGGGTAGCYAALTIAEQSHARVLICEKAHIKRSGCLAAGVNALNAYIAPNVTPMDYVAHVKKDACDIIRGDLSLTMSEGLNRTVEKLDSLGLVFLKDTNGAYITRGRFNIKINGENIMPILADSLAQYENISIKNRINITDLEVDGDTVIGAFGFDIRKGTPYHFIAKAVIVATGGASGLYKPNHAGFSQHKMWYSPFNTGSGYAMGLRAGAEMTSLEMRFIALRCKDTIAPTGTLALGVGARQINAKGEDYSDTYGQTTSERIYGTVRENIEGRGPCFLQTKGISSEQDESLLHAYFNMAPSQSIKWLENGKMPSEENVEIEGSEPYVVGGHTAGGYWVDTNRQSTIHGLFAAGDVAGGCPLKFVTGALVEGEISAKSVLAYVQDKDFHKINVQRELDFLGEIEDYLKNDTAFYTLSEIEDSMQTIMDHYAGGIGTFYMYNTEKLGIARERIAKLAQVLPQIKIESYQDLMELYELRDRLLVCKALIAHLDARKETRWHSFAEHTDYPERDDEKWRKYVNSRLVNGEIEIRFRELVGEGEYYEHQD